MDPVFLIDSPSRSDEKIIMDWVTSNRKIYVVEPFYSYHHQSQIGFFPNPLPSYVHRLIHNGHISLIAAASFDSRSIYPDALENAVEMVELVYPRYKQEISPLADYVIQLMESKEGERVFKKLCCDALSIFFSFNLLLKRIRLILRKESILVHSQIDVNRYHRMMHLMTQVSSPRVFIDERIAFSSESLRRSDKRDTVSSLKLITKLVAQFLGSLVLRPPDRGKNRRYRYGVGVLAPERQLRKNQRGPLFFVDNEIVLKAETVVLSMVHLKEAEFDRLKKKGTNILNLPRPGHFFSDRKSWGKLLLKAIRMVWQWPEEIRVAAGSVFHYGVWKHILSYTKIENFITHGDFGYNHIPRNIALQQCGVRTWYFTDSSSFGLNYRTSDSHEHRHPFWCYLYYDHFLTWSAELADYFRGHPGTSPHTDIIGCIWAQHIPKGKQRKNLLNKVFGDFKEVRSFVLAAFTSTYTVNGATSYDEAIRFIEHLGNLIDEFSDLYIIVKEKKSRNFHQKVEPLQGLRYIEMLENLERHPRIRVLRHDTDASELIGASDLCVSFPFTSTTFEALSANHPAIWHDACGHYKHVPYSSNRGAVTHGYTELVELVAQLIEGKQGNWSNPFTLASPLMDPFRDGHAIDRFRKALSARSSFNK